MNITKARHDNANAYHYWNTESMAIASPAKNSGGATTLTPTATEIINGNGDHNHHGGNDNNDKSVHNGINHDSNKTKHKNCVKKR
eukprot:scaffold591619_cov24-Prasinocladus_malaysianus.AAC.1